MDVTLSLSLLLLICCLCTAQLQTQSDDQVFPLGKQSQAERREPRNAADPRQTCPQDIHALLREMSSTLAVLKLQMQNVQTENKAQAAKLDSQKTEVERQKTEVDKLMQQLQAQTAELISIKARTNVTENQVEALRRDGEVKQVAFSASLFASGHGDVGPFNHLTPLVFRHVVTNIGNAYNPNSGFFVAPVRGAYHFEIYILGRGHASRSSAAALFKNGEHIVLSYEHQPTHVSTSANGATLLLEVGDVVSVRLWVNSWVHDNGYRYTTFSGHLLFTM